MSQPTGADRLHKRLDVLARREGLQAIAAVRLPQPALGFPTAVSLVLPLARAVLEPVAAGCSPTMTYYHHYRTANALLDRAALLVAGMLENHGCRALPVPASQTLSRDEQAGAFPHKTAAHLAGLGWIGRHALLVTPGHGPAVRLATVLTDLPAAEAAIPSLSRCGSCRACVEACPAGAIKGAPWEPNAPREALVDAQACLAYMREHFMGIGRGSVCGVCVAICPVSCSSYNT